MACKVQVQSKARSLLKVLGGGCFSFVGIAVYNQNSDFYSGLLMPLVHSVTSAETAHKMAINIAKHTPFLIPNYNEPKKPFDLVGSVQKLIKGNNYQQSQNADINSNLSTTVFGIKFKNPIGLAAGFDKNAEAIDGLARLGFGFLEVGTVTPVAQDGNDKPRVFRLLKNRAIINRYGFSNDGHDVIQSNLDNVKVKSKNSPPVVGLNLGKNKSSDINSVDDYIKGMERFVDHQNVDYFTINISSPNTPGLRTLQSGSSFNTLLDSIEKFKESVVRNSNPIKPILIKIAPDLTTEERKIIAKSIVERNKKSIKRTGTKLIDGIIVSNTTISRPDGVEEYKNENGGLSGEPLKEMSTELIRDMYKLTNGEVVIIGVGGVSNGSDAFEKIAAGSSLIQVYTCLSIDGPPVVNKIKVQLSDILREKGYLSVSEAVGIEHRLNKK